MYIVSFKLWTPTKTSVHLSLSCPGWRVTTKQNQRVISFKELCMTRVSLRPLQISIHVSATNQNLTLVICNHWQFMTSVLRLRLKYSFSYLEKKAQTKGGKLISWCHISELRAFKSNWKLWTPSNLYIYICTSKHSMYKQWNYKMVDFRGPF